MISPMHFPVMLCGFNLRRALRRAGGPDPAAAALSAVSDAAAVPHRHRHGLRDGHLRLVCGLLYGRLQQNLKGIYLSLIAAMIAGRIVWASPRSS